MASIDVTIRGAGAFGLAVAWACIQRGARVRVIDPGGVGAGSSGGIVGALAPHVPERWNAKKAMQFDALRDAAAYWAAVARVGGTDPGYARTGRLQPVADDAALALAGARAAEADRLWQGVASWRLVRAEPWSGWAPPTPSGWLIHDTLTARLHPRRATAALAAAVTASGGEILSDGPEQGRLVLATGWRGLHDLSAELGHDVGGGVKGQAVLFRADAAGKPQLFAEALHVVPHADGTVAVGSTSERDFDSPDATDARADALVLAARRLCPMLAEAPVIGTWAGVRPRARSRAPMLGAHPARDGVFIANGGFKIGFAMAAPAADMLADLILDGHHRIPPEFRVEASLPKPKPTP